MILFIGQLFKGSTAKHRFSAIEEAGYNTASIDSQIVYNKILLLFDRLLIRIFTISINAHLLNKKLLKIATQKIPETIWVDKGLFLYPKTLKNLRLLNLELKVIHYSPDDMMNPANQTKNYLKCISLYDLHVTTKSYNVDELYYLGAKKVLFVNNAFAPEIHKPYDLTPDEITKYGSDVSFIGGPEKERAETINWLAENDVKLTLWGNGWEKYLKKNSNVTIKNGWFADEEYSKIICATKINLAFLRKVNRDLQTTRTMEIPGCGGFMIGERTVEHQKLFIEGEGAVFFSDNNELKRKIEYYLGNEKERKTIALNGLKRCKESGYDNITMVRNVLKVIK